MTCIRKPAPICLILHAPETAEGKEELQRCVSHVHAEAVTQALKSLTCPPQQKLHLLDAVIAAIKEKIAEKQSFPPGPLDIVPK